MEHQESNVLLGLFSQDGYSKGFFMLVCMVLSWIIVHRWSQKNKNGPKTWPLVGAAIEQLMNYDRMHDWLVKYLSESNSVVVPMPFTTYTYIADPANVEHVLKTNFANYPKVI
ncbi:PREDICTED: cytochrome P450 [Prunus dulcis]|uniref:PREDICTED: cytochrome P450 n=1 Tax=Prunus dulcis TaxID=3755 RepID=A0A5E4EXV7_PRUDU|nr:PREDICTED: cytochrome P450 [Prunus dulcis]